MFEPAEPSRKNFGTSVGSGACTVALYPATVDEQVCMDSLAVGTRVSAFECKVEGTGLGINMAIHYFDNARSRKPVEDVYIFVTVSMQSLVLINIVTNVTFQCNSVGN